MSYISLKALKLWKAKELERIAELEVRIDLSSGEGNEIKILEHKLKAKKELCDTIQKELEKDEDKLNKN